MLLEMPQNEWDRRVLLGISLTRLKSMQSWFQLKICNPTSSFLLILVIYQIWDEQWW